MKQTPDESGRIIVSYKLNHEEVGRAKSNCKALQIHLNEYMNDGLIMKNDHTENNSPYIDIKAKSKIVELIEDLSEKMEKLVEQDTHISFLKKQLEMQAEELAGYKKVEEKV